MDVFVRPGDSMLYYSQIFGLPLPLITDSNPTINAQALEPNQRIHIPGYVTKHYTTQHGDSLLALAQKSNLPEEAILLLNPTVTARELQIGQSIVLPVRVTWRVVKGKQPYDYRAMMRDIQTLHMMYPFLCNKSIGHSVMGKEIPGLFIGHGQKCVHFNAAFHANEWITTPILLTCLNDFLLALTNQHCIRDISPLPLYLQTTLVIVPMVNPDGVDLVLNGPPANDTIRANVIDWNDGNPDFSGWKANLNGVDLNDQFPAAWDLERAHHPKTPGPRDYGGERPLSQPESLAIAKLTREMDFACVFALHTQGEVIYWGFQEVEPPEAETLVNEFARVSGYEPVKFIDSYAGYKDWFIHRWRRPGFTIELGLGTNPLPLDQFDDLCEKMLGIFLAALYS